MDEICRLLAILSACTGSLHQSGGSLHTRAAPLQNPTPSLYSATASLHTAMARLHTRMAPLSMLLIYLRSSFARDRSCTVALASRSASPTTQGRAPHLTSVLKNIYSRKSVQIRL